MADWCFSWHVGIVNNRTQLAIAANTPAGEITFCKLFVLKVPCSMQKGLQGQVKAALCMLRCSRHQHFGMGQGQPQQRGYVEELITACVWHPGRPHSSSSCNWHAEYY